MPALTVAEMLAAETAARQTGWTEERLLELAGTRLGRSIGRFFPHPGTAVAYLGKGHNAGDALVALAVLRDEFGWRIGTRQGFSTEEMAPLCRVMRDRHAIPSPWTAPPNPADHRSPLLLIDGLVGIGASGPLRDPLPPLVAEMNRLRAGHGAIIAAVDLPSGIDADTGQPGPCQVAADATFMIANAKAGLLRAGAANFTGALAVVPVEALARSGSSDLELIHPQTHSFGKSPRPYEFHKGMAGRVSILAGSADYTGAAALCATGSLRAGAGLVSLFVPKSIHHTVASRCPPEIIVRGFSSPLEAFAVPADSMIIGCGLGTLDEKSEREILTGISSSAVPTVLDADALNLISRHCFQHSFQSHHIITPHPGEFARIAPELSKTPREEAVRKFVKKHRCTLLLKGSRTLIGHSSGIISCNSTGHPGMASGGQGDLLSGVIGALLAAGIPSPEAAGLGAWVCGRASEIAVWNSGQSAESLTASDSARHLGAAFHDWHCSLR